MTTFQTSAAVTRQKKHRKNNSKTHDYKKSILTNVNKTFQEEKIGTKIGTKNLVPGSVSKCLVNAVIALSWAVIRKISLWYFTDLDHIIAMCKIVVKFHNIPIFQSSDSDSISLYNSKFVLPTVLEELVTISISDGASYIEQLICRPFYYTGLLFSFADHAFALISYLILMYRLIYMN